MFLFNPQGYTKTRLHERDKATTDYSRPVSFLSCLSHMSFCVIDCWLQFNKVLNHLSVLAGFPHFPFFMFACSQVRQHT